MRHAELGDEETTRSGLFMDQMRIVKEMREKDAGTGRTGELIRPRYLVWENVEGAKTSPGGNRKGEDFAAVIEEIIRVSEPKADIHVRIPDGGWPNAGCYFAEDGSWSLAWKLVDAQYFGTPQRRRRIALLADFGGLTAPEIMFDPQLERTTEDGEPVSSIGDSSPGSGKVSSFPKGLQGNPEQGAEEREGTPCGTESCSGSAGKCLNNWDVQSKHIQPTDGIAESLYAGECRYGGGESYLLDDQESTSYTLKIRGGVEIDSAGKRAGKGPLVQTELSGTLGVSQDQTLIQTSYGLDCQGGKGGANYAREVCPPILSDSHGTPHAVCGINGDVAGTLDASYYKGCGERQGIEREVVIDRQGVDLYNGQVTGDIAATISSESCVTNSRNGPYIMETENSVAVDPADQKPVVLAFSQNQREEVRDLGDVAGSVDAERGTHQQTFIATAVDCRNCTENRTVNGTLQAKSNGGFSYNCNNVVREGAIPYGISAYESNAMKSKNPYSGVYKADTSRTLDNNGGNPSCNQGGIAVVEPKVRIMNPTDSQGNQIADSNGVYPTVRGCGGAGYQQGYCFDRTYTQKTYPIEGNGSRPSHFGSGYGQDGDPSFTLNHVEQHAVATYDARGNGDGYVACTLTGDHQDRVTDYTALVLENDSP